MRQRRVDHGLIKNASATARTGRGVTCGGAGLGLPRMAVRAFAALVASGGLPAARHRSQPVRVMWFQALVFPAVRAALLTTRLGQADFAAAAAWFLLSTLEAVYAIAGMKDGLSAQVMFHIARNERWLTCGCRPRFPTA